MKTLLLITAALALLATAAFLRTNTRATTITAAAPQSDSACVSYVPREWGQYKGGSNQAGLAFEDTSGTLRFVTNLPCGAVPVVSLEIRRPAPKN